MEIQRLAKWRAFVRLRAPDSLRTCDTIGCIEIDEYARETLQRNRPSWRLVSPGDVRAASRTMTPQTFGLRRRELALLAGGPPCQPFSKAAQWSAGSMRGVRDPRARCWEGFM